jgi:hypothetical protein
MKITTPKIDLIEKTAAEFSALWFEAARSSGMTKVRLQGEVINLLKFKNNPRFFARAHLEKFIPAATHALIEILSKETTSEEKKRLIYDAVMERTNDEQLDQMGKFAKLPEFEKIMPDYKADDVKPVPVIVNTQRLEHGKK